ncbi:uncharacterized protein LOC131543905 [Onychostoma macrolepis]|uniref:uncharacterized protein LOC131543905 n=1 Tax=Onychostoma macrolepis TaxID=369639 RepID=UPI00272AEC4B|nr:uncharacterized protein LOC131543905 [Onychostoma macrolepis]
MKLRIVFVLFVICQGDNKHKYVFVNELRSWRNAQTYCRQHHTELVSVRNEEENRQIQQLIPAGHFATSAYSKTISSENLAQKGTATQSSTRYSLQSAERAIDGGKDSSISSSSCATTNWESHPWWRLDLQVSVYQVNIVVVYRDDSFPGKMKNIQVKFGNSLQNNGNNNPSCAVISSDAAANRVIYFCSDWEGRYVNVFYNDWWTWISVCEVEVYETDSSKQLFMKIVFNSTADLSEQTVSDNLLKELKSAMAVRGITNVTLSWSQTPEKVMIHNQRAKENLARRGTATQSTVLDDLSADRAIDGGKDISMSSGSCAVTHMEPRPWWRLDLQAAYRVSIVVVTYRQDCCPDSRKDFEIRFGNSLLDERYYSPSCAVISSDSAANSVTYSCSDREGRYVLIHRFIKALFLCEVEVYESDISMRSFMKIVFNSTTNLSNQTVTDIVLKELKSAMAVRGITNVTLSWSQTPEKVMIHKSTSLLKQIS